MLSYAIVAESSFSSTALPCGLVVGSGVGVHAAASIHDRCWIAIGAIGLVHAEGGKGFRQL